jgi:catechol 2,3-dioxygenase-like lactoylglutathione lyase family enzyme
VRTVVLIVQDVEAATRWYRYVLGFRLESERMAINGMPIEAHLRRGGYEIVLVHAGAST